MGTASASCLGPAGFRNFSSRQRLHWTGPVSCWHHYHLNTADVVSVRAHSVSAVCACAIVLMSYERQLSRPRRAQGRSPLSIRLLVHALPTVTHLRLHWTGPPAPLSRGILFFPPTNPSASRPQPQARRATSSRPYHVSLRDDRAKPTIFVTLFDRLYCLNC